MPFFNQIECALKTVEKYGLKGKQLRVKFKDSDKNPARTFPVIKKLIQTSRLPLVVKKRALSVFYKIAAAEARIHHISFNKVHFHEISAADTLLDVIGVCMAFHLLDVKAIHCSPLPMGNGTVTFSHGTWPLPAPATLVLLGKAPVYKTNVLGELVTPTGAALVAEFVSGFGASPIFRIEKVGQGFGTAHRPELPNVLRILLGRPVSKAVHIKTIFGPVTGIDKQKKRRLEYESLKKVTNHTEIPLRHVHTKSIK